MVKKNEYNKLTSIKNKFSLGQISREKYWDAMQLSHLNLREYHELLDNSDIESIQINSENLIINLHCGAKFYWDPEEVRGSANVLVNDGVNEPGYSDIIFAAAQNKKTIFDIGANVGYYTVHLAKKLCNYGGHIHAFEPLIQTFDRLCANINLNNLTQFVTLNNIGLSDKEGTVEFFQPKYSGSVASSMKNLHPEEYSQISQVKMETLDEYCNKKNIRSIDVMKIDVEGAELLVVQGGSVIIQKSSPIIFIELLRKWSNPFGYHPNDLLKILYGYGYKCWTQENERIIPFEWMTDATVQTNFILVQESFHGKPSQWLPINRSV